MMRYSELAPGIRRKTQQRASMTDLPKFFDLLSGARDEFESMIRSHVDEILRRLALVKRDEFEAVQELASRARESRQRRRVAARRARIPPRRARKRCGAESNQNLNFHVINYLSQIHDRDWQQRTTTPCGSGRSLLG